MTLTKTNTWLVVLLVSVVLSSSSVWSQVDSRLLNIEEFIATGDCETEDGFRFAAKVITLARREFDRLESLENRGLLADEDIERLDTLAVALSPIYDSDNRIQTARRMGPKLMSIVAAAYSIVGQERISDHGMELAIREIEQKSRLEAKLKTVPESVFIYKKLSAVLEFSEDQKKAFDELVIKVEKKLDEATYSEFSRQEKLLSRHWNELLNTLEHSKKEVAISFLKEPVQWFRRLGRTSEFTIKDIESGYHSSIPEPLLHFRSNDGRQLFHLTPNEIRQNGIEYAHAHLQVMFKDQFFWEEIEFTEEQKEKFRTGLSIVSTSGYHAERLDELLSGKACYADTITTSLVKHQLDRLASIEIQYLTSEFESSVGLLHPVFRKFLKLDEVEIRNIKIKAAEYEGERSKSMQRTLEKRKQIIFKFKLEFEKLLTGPQRNRFKKIQRYLSSFLQIRKFTI